MLPAKNSVAEILIILLMFILYIEDYVLLFLMEYYLGQFEFDIVREFQSNRDKLKAEYNNRNFLQILYNICKLCDSWAWIQNSPESEQ